MTEPTVAIPTLREIADTDEVARRKEFFRKSLDYFLLLIKKEPVNVPAWGHIGLLLYELGRFEEGLGYFQKIIDLEPDNAVAWDAIGFIRMERGDFPGAAAAFERVIELSPKRADVAADLALSLFHSGKYPAARAALERRVGKLMGTREHYLVGRIALATDEDPSPHYERALAAYHPPEGPIREGVYATLAAIRGAVLAQLGREQEARDALLEAADRASLTDPDRMILSAVELTFKVRGAFIREVKGML